jgi:hypothetical protein
MKQNNKSVDSIFREGMKDTPRAYNEGAWENMGSLLNKEMPVKAPKKFWKSWGLGKTLAVGLVTTSIAAAGIIIALKSEPDKDVITNTQSPVNNGEGNRTDPQRDTVSGQPEDNVEREANLLSESHSEESKVQAPTDASARNTKAPNHPISLGRNEITDFFDVQPSLPPQKSGPDNNNSLAEKSNNKNEIPPADQSEENLIASIADSSVKDTSSANPSNLSLSDEQDRGERELSAVNVPLSRFFSPTSLTNPAYTGLLVKPRLEFQYTDDFNPGYISTILFDMQVNKRAGNAGLFITQEMMSENYSWTRTQFGIRYARPLKIGKRSVLVPGVSVAALHQRFDASSLCFRRDPITGECLDSTQENIREKLTRINTGGGLLYYFGKDGRNFLSLSLDYLNRPKLGILASSTSRVYPVYSLEGGKYIPLQPEIDRGWSLFPFVGLQGSYMGYNITPGVQVSKSIATLGAAYSFTPYNGVSVKLQAGLTFRRYRIGYSYAHNLIPIESPLVHQLSMRYVFGKMEHTTE